VKAYHKGQCHSYVWHSKDGPVLNYAHNKLLQLAACLNDAVMVSVWWKVTSRNLNESEHWTYQNSTRPGSREPYTHLRSKHSRKITLYVLFIFYVLLLLLCSVMPPLKFLWCSGTYHMWHMHSKYKLGHATPTTSYCSYLKGLLPLAHKSVSNAF